MSDAILWIEAERCSIRRLLRVKRTPYWAIRFKWALMELDNMRRQL
jgi:hypothetical protein